MTTIREWVQKLEDIPGRTGRRVYNGIRNQMKADDDTFSTAWWDTTVSEADWKTMLKEALK